MVYASKLLSAGGKSNIAEAFLKARRLSVTAFSRAPESWRSRQASRSSWRLEREFQSSVVDCVPENCPFLTYLSIFTMLISVVQGLFGAQMN